MRQQHRPDAASGSRQEPTATRGVRHDRGVLSKWLSVAGLATQTLGVFSAVWQFRSARRTYLASWLSPLKRARAATTLVARRVVRRPVPPNDRPVVVGGSIAISGHVVVAKTSGTPALDVPEPEWRTFVAARLKELDEARFSDTNHLAGGVQRLNERADKTDQNATAAAMDVERRFRDAAVGPNGRGLTIAWWSIALVIIGGVLQLAGALASSGTASSTAATWPCV